MAAAAAAAKIAQEYSKTVKGKKEDEEVWWKVEIGGNKKRNLSCAKDPYPSSPVSKKGGRNEAVTW